MKHSLAHPLTALRAMLTNPGQYLKLLAKWIVCAIITGAVCGVVGTALHFCVDYATELRGHHNRILYFLPLAGLVIAGLYRLFGVKKDQGTNLVLIGIRRGERIPLNMTPLIFISTVLTHLCGGSVGREGAALQLGGSLGATFGRIFRLKGNDARILTMAGMSALFTALFGTPVTAIVFSMEVLSVGVLHYSAFLPCALASVTAKLVAGAFGVAPTAFALRLVPAVDWSVLWRAAVLAAACAAVSILFICCMHLAEKLMHRCFPNQFLRAAAGGALIVGLTLLIGSQTFNGAGMDTITLAVEGGKALWYAFLLKILFTALSIASGFKGGEIVPTFFIGATFGCVFGGLLGLDPGFGAAIGLIALFCSVVNCPLASVVLSVELFGGSCILVFALVCAVSYLLSGNYSLYSGQQFYQRKLGEEPFDYPDQEDPNGKTK